MGRETKLWVRPFLVLYKLWVILVLVLPYVACYPVYYYHLFIRPDFAKVLRIQRWVVKTFAPIAGFFVSIEGGENFPNGALIATPNHSSYMDIIMMFLTVPGKLVFMGKSELEKWPLFGIHFTSGQNISVNRKSARDSLMAYKKSVEAIDNGASLVIFPEATIPVDTPNLKNFKSGAFRLAIEKQVPIVPITFLDNHKRLRSGGFFKALASPGLIRVIIHKPIYTKGMTEDDYVSLRNQTRDTIAQALREHED